MVTQQAMKSGFTGGLVIDYPNSTKAKKIYLVLFTGGNDNQLPKGLAAEQEHSLSVSYSGERQRFKTERKVYLETIGFYKRRNAEEKPKKLDPTLNTLSVADAEIFKCIECHRIY
ncbi:putative 18S rRNA (guanine-N(7))-methyltransferase-like isoform X1 [Leptotrombidium deliense]|uniref:Putative 18S rRNA (Guanine-N(7))-methyltransferase-like isoform X1 n=1 Tax=Leptotrombidium deliense TaxID=299467 RepID=A0A443RS79_9ACAR|nr:putative 18S rRNA (guanine-N(7))-methyltransferase-like isoform X1 [Leptotrombidium deliense]